MNFDPGRGKTLWMDWAQLALLTLLSPLFLFPSKPLLWIFFALPFFLAARGMMRQCLLGPSEFDWPIALMCLSLFASLFFLSDIGPSVEKILGLVFGILMFYSLNNVLVSEKTLRFAIGGFVVLGTGLSIFSFLGLDWRFNMEPGIEKIIIPMSRVVPRVHWKLPGAEEGFNANAVAGTLSLVFPLAVILFLAPGQKENPQKTSSLGRLRMPSLATAILVMGVTLIVTQTIATWIAVALSVWIAVVPKRWKIPSAGIAAVMIGVLILAAAHRPGFIHRYVGGKIVPREKMWILGIESVEKNPIFGLGMNRFRLIPTIYYFYAHAHNHLIHTAAELGIPGLTAYTAILLIMAFVCLSALKSCKTPWLQAGLKGLGAGQLAFFIFGIGDSIPLGAKTGVFFWISLAMITSLAHFSSAVEGKREG